MRATVLAVILWNLGVAGVALAQDKTEPAKPVTEAMAIDAGPAAEPNAAPDATKAEEPAQAEPAKADKASADKTSAANAGPTHRAFQSSWADASPDEKALFLEAFGESSKLLREGWDKATSDDRKKVLRWHPVLGARPLKHHWVSATPEERAAFLESHPRTLQKIKEAWEKASPEQRTTLALEHPYLARKALHHAWMQALPQEKIAFVAAHPAIASELKARWTNANEWQRRWYATNYPGIEQVASGKPWAETSTGERVLFLEANPGIAEKAREAWQKAQPEMRAALVRKWPGWPLRAYQARLEKGGKPAAAAKSSPSAPAKATPSGAKK